MEKIKFKNKSEFRNSAKDRLSKLSAKYPRDKKVCQGLLNIVSCLKPQRILVYIPLSIEPNILPLITLLRKKTTLYAPFMEGFSFKMVRYRLPLELKRFGIKEPKNSLARKPKIDLAIVPVIGVDGHLKRIGYGKGMYDRFFESLQPRPTIVFVQREMCMTPSFLGDKHDIEADIYLTPHHTIIQRGYNGLRIISGRCSSRKRRCRVFHRQKDGSGQL